MMQTSSGTKVKVRSSTSVNWCSVGASSHEAISSSVLVKTLLTVWLGISWLGLTVLVVPEVHLVDDLLLYCVTRLRDSPRNTAFCMEEVLGAVGFCGNAT